MSGRILYGSAVGLASGIFFRSFFVTDLTTMITGGCVVALALLAASRSTYLRPWRWCVVFFILLFFVGVARFESEEAGYDKVVSRLASREGETAEYEGVIVGDPERRDIGLSFVIRMHSTDVRDEEVYVRITTDSPIAVRYGEEVTVSGTLEQPQSFESELGRMFPYREYLRARGVTHVMRKAEIKEHAGQEGFPPLSYIFAVKHNFLASIETILPEPHAGFASGLLLGEKHALGESLEDTFRTVGIIHIIVLSGYNLTIVAESIMRLLSFVLSPRVRAIVGACSIGVFAIMVGLSATVVRASIMALLVLLARAAGKTYIAVRALALAGMGMVIWNPYVLAYDPGFQLSFLATLGLIFGAPLVGRMLSSVPTRLQIREYITSTIATQLFVAPLLLYSVGSLSLISIVANVLVLIAVPFAMLAIFIAGALGMFLGDGAMVVSFPAYVVLSYMLAVAETLARIPFASVSVQVFPFWYVAVLYSVLVVIVVMIWRRKKPEEPMGPSGFFGL